MDEILASIRRIIESNDPVPPGAVTAMPEPEGFSGSAANDDMEDVPLTIDEVFAPRPEAVRPPMHEDFAPEPERASVEDAPPHEAAPAPQKSLSLADVAARVRAASERNPGLRELAPRPAVETAAAPSAESPLLTSRMAAAGGAQAAARVSTEWDGQPPRIEAQASVSEDAQSVQPEPAAAEEPVPASSLISVDAGQQVARSFQDLAVAIDQAERRSYDEIAAELLRPMLQEWLDENLPTLVERLVREEIERVARGNRR